MILAPDDVTSPAGRGSHREGSPMTRTPTVSGPSTTRGPFQTSRHSATYLMMAFERVRPPIASHSTIPRA